jgi:outer membrane protein OmpA-like peptidoglycan-associated protein
VLGLSACSTAPAPNPIDWWHSLEGGPIAAARPPPPNADAPYPSLSGVPDRPPGNDEAARGQIANALVADRANAQYAAAIAPLTPAAPTPPPPPPPAVGDNTSTGSFAAATAPPLPPPPAPPRATPAPRATVEATPLPPPTATPAALPEMPQQPPPPAVLPGVAQATMPTPPPPTPPPAVKPLPPPAAGAPIPVSFVPGLAVLPTTAYAPLTALAQQRGGGSVAVVGFGAAADPSPAAQQAALPLALARARAIAAYLETAGVPASVIRIDAEADGQGGIARLIR